MLDIILHNLLYNYSTGSPRSKGVTSSMRYFEESMYRLIEETSTNLPADVRRALKRAQEMEDAGTRAALSLSTIADNIEMAETNVSPICQDTGMPTFIIKCPVGANQIEMKKQIRSAVARATKDGKLRTNSVDSLTGANTGDNLGPGTPVIHFEQWEKDEIEVRLILKGGGCENKNIQYSLPTELEGLGRGGPRSGRHPQMHPARRLPGARTRLQRRLHRRRHRRRPDDGLRAGEEATVPPRRRCEPECRTCGKLEEYIMENANKLGIGTMGFGGQVTLLGCKIGASTGCRPASSSPSPTTAGRSAARACGSTPRAGEIQDWLYPSAAPQCR